MSEAIKQYIDSFLKNDLDVLKKMEINQQNRRDIQPNVGKEVGRLIGLLIRLTNAKRVLELGSCIGYSSIWIGTALKDTGGQLISVEYNEKLVQEARENVNKAGLDDVISIIHGDAKEVIENLEGPFDLILQDSDKSLYPTLLNECINKTKVNGLILGDDALFKPMGIPEQFSNGVHHYNELVFRDDRLYSTMLPIGDGLTVSVKVKN